MVDRERVTALIKTTYPFHKMDDKVIKLVVDSFESETFTKGQRIFREGFPSDEDSLCILFEGKVRLTHSVGENIEDILTLTEGEMFGHEMLESNRKHPVSAYAATDVTLLKLNRTKINQLVAKVPTLTVALRLLYNSYLITLDHRFFWKGSDEIIYLVTHRHELWLLKQLPIVVGVVLFTLALLVLIMLAMPAQAAGFGLIMLLDLGLGYAWIRLQQNNWENNIVAVTNQRVLIQERKLFVYETRIEAPLNAILSVATETTQMGRALNYGNVVARTFAGAINLPMVMYPDQVASFLELQWGKTKSYRSRAEAASMENIVRSRLGYASKGAPPPSPSKAAQSTGSNTIMRGAENWLANLFQLRVETATGVIYKTHWIVLFRRVILHVLFFLTMFFILMGILFNLFVFPGGPAAALTLVFFLLLILGGLSFWIWYCYQEWANDLYIVSNDQIVDRVKKPFGKEDRKVAPLKSVQSVEFERGGVLGLLFNYGLIKISVGESILQFRSVYNPSDIQREIFKRMADRDFKEKQAARENEQKWVVDWIAAYHRVVEQEKKSSSGTGIK
jgi:hypothetical protein